MLFPILVVFLIFCSSILLFIAIVICMEKNLLVFQALYILKNRQNTGFYLYALFWNDIFKIFVCIFILNEQTSSRYIWEYFYFNIFLFFWKNFFSFLSFYDKIIKWFLSVYIIDCMIEKRNLHCVIYRTKQIFCSPKITK